MHAPLTMLNADLCALERENTELREELNKHQQGRDDSMPVLLVGSSIIRDNSSKDDAKLQVKSPSGAKLDDIHHEIGRRNEKYSHGTIHVDSNDCDKDDMILDSVVIGYKKRISEAKQCFVKVTLSNVLPRCGKHATNDKLYRFNADLLVLAK